MSSVSVYQEFRKKYVEVCSLPTEYPNEEFTRPNSLWARFTVIEGEEQQLDIGSELKTFRTPGLLIVQLFAPLNSGSIGILSQADVIADAFRNWGGPTLTCRAATVKEIGNDGYGYYQVNVTVPFHIDELH
jgi:hypothetical protein